MVTTYVDEAGWHIAQCPALPGCMTQGRTKEEALENIKDAIHGWLEVEAAEHQSAS